jgi:hypothetical protein
MEDVMLNDYVNHRGQTIKFDAERFEQSFTIPKMR